MKAIILALLFLFLPYVASAQWDTGLHSDSVDSARVKDASLSPNDIANGANGFINKASPVMLPFSFSAMPDTVNAPSDSLNGFGVGNFALPSEYAISYHVYNNDSPDKHRGIFLWQLKPPFSELKTLYMWMRGSLGAKPDSLLIHARIVGRATATDSTVVADSLFVPTLASTWEKKEVTLSASMTTDRIYTVMVEVYAANKNWVDLSPIYLKE